MCLTFTILDWICLRWGPVFIFNISIWCSRLLKSLCLETVVQTLGNKDPAKCNYCNRQYLLDFFFLLKLQISNNFIILIFYSCDSPLSFCLYYYLFYPINVKLGPQKIAFGFYRTTWVCGLALLFNGVSIWLWLSETWMWRRKRLKWEWVNWVFKWVLRDFQVKFLYFCQSLTFFWTFSISEVGMPFK